MSFIKKITRSIAKKSSSKPSPHPSTQSTTQHSNLNQNQNKNQPQPKHPDQPKAKPRTTPVKEPAAASAQTASTFASLGLSDDLLKALNELGYEVPSPIQAAVIPSIVKGSDLLGCAQTGTGKTAAFALPTLQRLSQKRSGRHTLRALILTPTRELAIQVAKSYRDYGRHLDLRSEVVFGGVGIEPQKSALQKGVDILIATPGRLLDLYQQGSVDFGTLEILILDEADRMLDMGFLPDVKRILKLVPEQKQTLLFSATVPSDIKQLSERLLKHPVVVNVSPVSSTSKNVEQAVYHVNRLHKRSLLLHVMQDVEMSKVIVFTRTKAIANRITKFLGQHQIGAEAIHGNKSQSARQKALENFRSGRTRVLVATDLAARGLDVDQISHVINFDLPNVAETYVHRIGRTGRAAASGKAISFCDGEERSYLRDIESLSQVKIPVIEDHPFPFDPKVEAETVEATAARGGGQGRHGRSRPASNPGQGRSRSRDDMTKKPGSRPARRGRPNR